MKPFATVYGAEVRDSCVDLDSVPQQLLEEGSRLETFPQPCQNSL